MSHNLSSGIISAAVLPFEDRRRDRLEDARALHHPGRGRRSAGDRDEHGGQRGQLAGSARAARGHPALQGDARGRVHAAVGAERHAHGAARRSRQAARRCGRRGPGDLPAGAGVPQRAVGLDDRRLPRRRRRGGEGAAAGFPDQLLQLSERHDHRALADSSDRLRSRTRHSTSSRRSTTSRKPTARSARSAS